MKSTNASDWSDFFSLSSVCCAMDFLSLLSVCDWSDFFSLSDFDIFELDGIDFEFILDSLPQL